MVSTASDFEVQTMAVIDDLRHLGTELERSYPVHARGCLKFRVKQIVYVAFSRDESVIRFAFPKEERAVVSQKLSRAYDLARPEGPG